jgi:hypothetical protein
MNVPSFVIKISVRLPFLNLPSQFHVAISKLAREKFAIIVFKGIIPSAINKEPSSAAFDAVCPSLHFY